MPSQVSLQEAGREISDAEEEEGSVKSEEAEGDLKMLHYSLWRWRRGPWTKDSKESQQPPRS